MNSISEYLHLLEPNQTIQLKAGEYLFKQNDTAKGIYLVKQGRIKLLRDTVDGNSVIMYTAQTNDSLAEASLFSCEYHCHAKADLDSDVLLYDKNRVLEYLSTNTETALKFIEVLAKQIQKLRLLLELRSIRSPRERFVQYLQLMCNSKNELFVRSTYKDLAITLGMSHETLYREISKLDNDGLIERDSNKITLKI